MVPGRLERGKNGWSCCVVGVLLRKGSQVWGPGIQISRTMDRLHNLERTQCRAGA